MFNVIAAAKQLWSHPCPKLAVGRVAFERMIRLLESNMKEKEGNVKTGQLKHQRSTSTSMNPLELTEWILQNHHYDCRNLTQDSVQSQIAAKAVVGGLGATSTILVATTGLLLTETTEVGPLLDGGKTNFRIS
jgi:hypothetical protein